MSTYTDWKAGEHYKVRDGREARVFMTDGGGNYPIIGAIKQPGGNWLGQAWTIAGLCCAGETYRLDLMPPEQKKHAAWLNVYHDPLKVFCCYASKEEADNSAGDDRIACIRVEYVDGEGL